MDQIQTPQRMIDPARKDNFLKGYKIQRWVLDLLDGSKAVEFERSDAGTANHNMPYDIEWNGLKIDIKSSWVRSGDTQYLFTISNKVQPGIHLCDYYFCVGLTNGYPMKVWFVPAIDLDFHTNFTPAVDSPRKSKYDKYLVWTSKKLKNRPSAEVESEKSILEL